MAVDVEIGLIVHNEAAMLPGFLQHWRERVKRIIVLDQMSNDDTVAIVRAEAPSAEIHAVRPHSGVCETHLNTLYALSRPPAYLLRTEPDERVSDESWARLLATLEALPDVGAWFISRRNFCDDTDISELLGDDWQLRVSRGPALRSDGIAHHYPEITNGAAFGYFDKDAIALEHRRSLDRIRASNKARDVVIGEQGQAMQAEFMKRLEAYLKARAPHGQ
jgi:hypothetical protein